MTAYQAFAAADEAWLNGRLDMVPAPWRGRVKRRWSGMMAEKFAVPAGRGLRSEAEYRANQWLVGATDRLASMRVPVDLADSDIVTLADRLAEQAMSMGEVSPGACVMLSDPAALRARLAGWVGRLGFVPPDCREHMPAVRRMTCRQWWRRAIRKAKARALEAAAIGLGYVHRGGEIYASDATVERRRQQRARNAASLDGTRAINLDTGDEFTLAELAARSVANPRIRRGELMVRIAGFESVAKGLEHAAEFVTVTCPSRFHAQRIRDGRAEPNPTHDGATPRDAQSYLARTWANCRAALWRRGIRPYGFRIAEPHHDGTPHWHLLLFVRRWLSPGRSAVARMRAIIRRYFLRADAGEPGARKKRAEFVAIDWSRGSAAGYVAKYVSKNIDGGGYEVQGDIETGAAVYPGERVEAWASSWGIRQFQQIGGPPVGVWRELRRMDSAAPMLSGDEYSEAVANSVAAADVGSWGRYVEIQGGPEVKRMDLAVKLARTEPGEAWDGVAGAPCPALPTRYGETRPSAVYGVFDVRAGMVFESVRYRWQIKREASPARESVARKSAGRRVASACGKAVGFPVGFAVPRTRVNNCSGPGTVTGPGRVWRPGVEGFIVPDWSREERETLRTWKDWRGGDGGGALDVGGPALAGREVGGGRVRRTVKADGAGSVAGGGAGHHPGVGEDRGGPGQ